MPCCIKSILAAALLAGGLSACSPAPPPAGPRELALLYTCGTRGTIHACDCTGGSAGGLARRQTHLKTQPAANRLLVDAGNVGAGAGARDRIDLDFLLRGYRALGYDAINAGRGEAILGADDLRALGQQYPELISANLVDPSARPVLPAYRIRTLPNGLRVALIGVIDHQLPAGEWGDGLSAWPPEEALARVLPEVEKQADLVVVLAYLDEWKMRALAELFFEIDVLVGGLVEQPLSTPVAINQSLMVAVTDRGKSVGRLDLRVAQGKAEAVGSDITVLYDQVAEAPEMKGLLDEHAQAVAILTNQATRATSSGLEGLTTLPGAQP